MQQLNKKVCFILCVGNTFFSTAQTSRIMSIEEMFFLADSCSRSIRTFGIAEQEAEQAVRIAKNARLPAIEASVSASYLGDAWLSDRNFSNGQHASMPHLGNNFAIEASQVVYAGGAISSKIAIAKLQQQLSRLDKEINRQDIRFLLVGNYLEIYKLKNQAEIYRSNIEQTRKLLSNIQAKQSQGIALRNDITRHELQLKSLELALTRINNSIDILNNQLIPVLGLPEDTEVIPDTRSTDKLPLVQEEVQWLAAALNNSPDLQQTRLNIQRSAYNEKIARSERLPSIALFAGDRFDGPITVEVPPINKNLNYWYVGIGVKFDLSSTYKSGKKINLAKLSTRKAEENKRLLEEHVRVRVKEAYICFQEAFTIYDTQVKSLELATQNYDVVNNRYLNELALITDMLDAANSKLSAELEVANARVNILFNYYKLKKATGNL